MSLEWHVRPLDDKVNVCVPRSTSLQSMTENRETEPLIMKPGVDGSVQEVVVKDKLPSLHSHQGNRLPQGSSSLFGATFIVVNASLGAGLLAFPFAFYSAGGVAPSMAVMVVRGKHVSTHHDMRTGPPKRKCVV